MATNLIYLDFENTTVDKQMLEKFIKQCQRTDLGQILRSSSKNVKCIFHRAIGFDNTYLVMLVVHYDNILIDLAKKYNFPRGFPILWIPDVRVQYFGFYPKFSNDDRQDIDDMREFDNVVSLEFFKKWSGFLGQLMVFKIGNKVYWTVTSKNSAINTSKFVQDAKRLFEPFVTADLANILAKLNLHVCAEIMSKADQTHGTIVLKESPVVTAVGRGCLYDLDSSAANINGERFVEFFDNGQLVDFCSQHGLPCDSAIAINNATSAKNFIQELSANRDFMTDDRLMELMAKHHDSIIVKKGTISHDTILGNCLEGLVIKLKYPDSSIIKKYKFAPYTIRTMLLREEFNNFIFGPNLKEKARSFVDHWCVSDAGKQHWYNFALEAFCNYTSFVSPNKEVGDHIHIAETTKSNENAEVQFNKMLENLTKGTVVICIGPIGSGKTSVAKELASRDTIFVIDGDVLDIGMDRVMKLGKERNDYSRWAIIKALMQGKVPVISTGGGILFSGGKQLDFVLKNQIYETLGIMVKVIVLVPGSFDRITQLDRTYNVLPVYEQTDGVRETVTRRVTTGEWHISNKFRTGKISEAKALDNFVMFITKKSKENAKFASFLVGEMDCVYGFPFISSKNYGIQKTLDYDSIIANVRFPEQKLAGNFCQVRLLVLINDAISGHITLQFDANRKISYQTEDFAALLSRYAGKISGQIVNLVSVDKKNTITFAVPDLSIHDDGLTHVTIDAGLHAAKDIGDVVRAMNSGNTSIQLLDKKRKSLTYNFATSTKTPCQIEVMAAFGI